MSFSDEKAAKYMERFLAKTTKTNGCWLWHGATGSNGYGQMQFEMRRQQAHRVAYQLFIGPIPRNLTLDHICRRITCVNPYHVRPMTMAENSRIGNRFTARTACHQGHPYSPENTMLYRGYRICRTCKREKDRKCRLAHLTVYKDRARLKYLRYRDKWLARNRQRYLENREWIFSSTKRISAHRRRERRGH